MNLIQEYIEIHEYELNELSYRLVGDNLHLKIPKTKLNIILNEKHIKQLENNKLLKDIPNIKYYKNYGFSIDTYGEFFLGTDNYFLYDIYGDVSEIDLKFNIGNTYIEFNSVSAICILLIEPYYSKFDPNVEDRGLEEYFYTLKIYNAPQEVHKDIVIKSLFYLNSHYLKTINNPLSIYQLIPSGYVEHSFLKEAEVEKTISRKRTLKRKDFINVEPLYFYNDACIQTRENQFLGFYRVLEFFFNRGLEKELESRRYNSSIEEKDIIRLIQNKDERSLLRNLINKILTKSEKKKLIDSLLRKKLIKDGSFDKFSNKLYEYRNSIVHAKENKLSNTLLPDIFNEKNDYQVWNYVIKYISEQCIKRMNCEK